MIFAKPIKYIFMYLCQKVTDGNTKMFINFRIFSNGSLWDRENCPSYPAEETKE